VSDFVFRAESGEALRSEPAPVDDSSSADDALKRLRKGEVLLYRGDFHNAKQLLSAMARRLEAAKTSSVRDAYRAERKLRAEEQRTLGHLLVELDGHYRLSLKRAPDVAKACEWAWGPPPPRTLTPLKTLLGVIGAAQWRTKGLKVPGLEGTLEPHYGVYSPTRNDYVALLDGLDARGKTVFDVGTGTGVLSFVLLQRGAKSATGSDVEPLAVACARANAQRLKLSDRFTAVERDGFPDGRADLVVCNPPWIPEPPRTRLDRAVFDEGGAFVQRFLRELPEHLTPGGRGVLLISDLPELLGLRAPGWLEEQLAAAGLEVESVKQTAPAHPKSKDRDDPLYQARSRETVRSLLLKVRNRP